MKFIFMMMLLTVSAASLSACQTSADLKNDRYSVDLDENDRYDGNYKHCPPGHAKKGWC
jgi:hypothetical protein